MFWAPKSNISFLGATRKERHDLTHRFGVLEEPLTLCATLCLLTTFYIPSCEARLCKLWLTSPKMIGTLIKNIESLPLENVLVWKIRLKNNVAFWVKAKFEHIHWNQMRSFILSLTVTTCDVHLLDFLFTQIPYVFPRRKMVAHVIWSELHASLL